MTTSWNSFNFYETGVLKELSSIAFCRRLWYTDLQIIFESHGVIPL